ncbi:MAG: hypothetical protein ACRC33_13635 [Gemmataceae bacterium]
MDLTRPAPLVVASHGMLIDGKDLMPRYARLSETARKHRYLAADPSAVGRSWGLGPRNRDEYAREGHEVKYLEVDGLGHAWAEKADVNEAMWKFFREHPRRK